jgi:6-phosphogluconolactonase
VAADAGELFKLAADEFLRTANRAVESQGRFAVCLAGGSTPRGLYAYLAADPGAVPWGKSHFFWGDERHVPPDHPASNYRMAQAAMLSKAPVAAENVHRIRGEYASAGQAAREYERTLREFFRLKRGESPRFDLVLLGMGADGHVASLFPGSAALHEERRLVVSNWVAKFNAERITLTARALNSGSAALFLVSGEDKARALKAVLEGPHSPEQYPAQLIRPADGRLLWLVDRAAASLLAHL